ncbi:19295_t:CDS:2, partial [Gigaspora rosea]
MEVQNVTSTDAINVNPTDSATSSLISVSSATTDNTTNVTGRMKPYQTTIGFPIGPLYQYDTYMENT